MKTVYGYPRETVRGQRTAERLSRELNKPWYVVSRGYGANAIVSDENLARYLQKGYEVQLCCVPHGGADKIAAQLRARTLAHWRVNPGPDGVDVVARTISREFAPFLPGNRPRIRI